MADSSPLIQGSKLRVLVVDDEEFIRDILADFLAMEGYEVRCAENGMAALTELSRGGFDLILSDLKMPKMGGLELLRETQHRYPATLTIIMTGFGTVETAIDAMKRGAYDYVLKPFKADEIVQVVSRAMQQKRLAAENLRLREAVSLYKVSEAISASLSMEEVVHTITNAAISDAQADWVETWLEDGEGGYKRRLSEKVDANTLSGAVLKTDSVLEHLKENRPTVVNDALALQLFDNLEDHQIQSVALVALTVRQRPIGWICAVSTTVGRRFDEGQRKMLSMIASRAAAAIDNAQLYENLQATFRQTIQSLARTIDKMDRYTAGHSERVARYAQRLARSLGLSAQEIEIVRQAALMHDIGKIGCVMNLNKPDKLTQEEYQSFKRHPEIGRDILDPIQFLQPVIPGVHLHHEQWNGSGYPLGLEGNSIPLIARIISVADTYDAMTSNRAYRRALPHEVSVDEISRCAGSQFDPDVAGTFEDEVDDWLDEWRDNGIVVPS